MTNKELYEEFCNEVYIPIYSKSWWLNSVCQGSCNWDVWFYKKNGNLLAAMPYYFEKRGEYKYITKAPLTQNNGIIFKYPANAKFVRKQEFEEEVIEAACEFIESLDIDVYEQQYHYDFKNWLPFFWNRYKAITRYTYVIDDLSDMEKVWSNISSKTRSIIRKGYRNAVFSNDISVDQFFYEHEKVFKKQGLECPFSYNFFVELVKSCKKNNCYKMFCAKNSKNDIMSVLFLVWDEKSAYHLLGGSVPEFQNKDTYCALIWEAIKFTADMGLKYDFEGSVIKRISKAFREFGGIPQPYFRIRKVFRKEIIEEETKKMIIADGVK